jgi:hypothetical protein
MQEEGKRNEGRRGKKNEARRGEKKRQDEEKKKKKQKEKKNNLEVHRPTGTMQVPHDGVDSTPLSST